VSEPRGDRADAPDDEPASAKPGDDVFSASDLEPSDDDRARSLRANIERVAAALGALAAGAYAGGTVALGAMAAPSVFAVVPSPLAGDAMGAAFARFDRVALGCAALVLLVEIARTVLALGRARTLGARARRVAGLVFAAGVAYAAFVLTPAIRTLHEGGARRGVGEAGATLQAVHDKATSFGKLNVGLAAVLVLLHVLTLPLGRPEGEDLEEVPGPLPPGPRSE